MNRKMICCLFFSIALLLTSCGDSPKQDQSLPPTLNQEPVQKTLQVEMAEVTIDLGIFGTGQAADKNDETDEIRLPFIYENTCYIPVRRFFNSIDNRKITWNEETKTLAVGKINSYDNPVSWGARYPDEFPSEISVSYGGISISVEGIPIAFTDEAQPLFYEDLIYAPAEPLAAAIGLECSLQEVQIDVPRSDYVYKYLFIRDPLQVDQEMLDMNNLKHYSRIYDNLINNSDTDLQLQHEFIGLRDSAKVDKPTKKPSKQDAKQQAIDIESAWVDIKLSTFNAGAGTVVDKNDETEEIRRPFIYKDTCYISVRSFADSMDQRSITWDEDTNTLDIGNADSFNNPKFTVGRQPDEYPKQISVSYGGISISKGGRRITFTDDAKPLIYENLIYAPAEPLAAAFGLECSWQEVQIVAPQGNYVFQYLLIFEPQAVSQGLVDIMNGRRHSNIYNSLIDNPSIEEKMIQTFAGLKKF